MKTLKGLIASLGLLSVLCVIPAMAQITNRVTFDAHPHFMRATRRCLLVATR
jgi:hypothetical protein